MQAKPACNFAQLLEEIVPQESVKKENARFQPVAQTINDSLYISVQAQKAFPRSLNRDLRSRQEAEAESEVKLDSQGNRIKISSQGNQLAADNASMVAWETVIKKPSKPVAPVSSSAFLPALIYNFRS